MKRDVIVRSAVCVVALGLGCVCLWAMPCSCSKPQGSGDGQPASSRPPTESAGKHPSLLLSDARLEQIRQQAKTDPLMAECQASIRSTADRYLAAEPVKYVNAFPAMLGQSRRALGHILTLGMQYRLSGEKKYADRAVQEIMAVCAFPDWYPQRFLCVAEMSLAVAIGYVWCYDVLSPEQRAAIREALVEKSLSYAPAAYNLTQEPSECNWRVVGNNHVAVNNWNPVCNGGLLAAALVVKDEDPELAGLVVEGVRRWLPQSMANYAPDGAWPEGPVYWVYATTFCAFIIDMLEEAEGTDYGLSEQPGFSHADDYFLQVFGPTGLAFSYGDSRADLDFELGCQPVFAWLTQRYHQPAIERVARERLRKFLQAPVSGQRANDIEYRANRYSALNALWFPAKEKNDEQSPLDARFRGAADLAFFRSSWGDSDALWLAFKAGTNRVTHAHLDLGSFVLEADGVRWAEDLGQDDYSLPGYFKDAKGGQRWTYFRLNNLSHNTVGPGDTLQDVVAIAPMTAFVSEPGFSYAVADMTGVYPGAAQKALRGVAMLGRAQVLIQDEWTGIASAQPLVWRMMTGAAVGVSADGRTATLSQDGKTLKAEILQPQAAYFSTASATPPTRAENQNDNQTLLTATVPAGEKQVRLAILLTPVGARWPVSPAPVVVPISEWPAEAKP